MLSARCAFMTRGARARLHMFYCARGFSTFLRRLIMFPCRQHACLPCRRRLSAPSILFVTCFTPRDSACATLFTYITITTTLLFAGVYARLSFMMLLCCHDATMICLRDMLPMLIRLLMPMLIDVFSREKTYTQMLVTIRTVYT